ncbi:MAG: DUF3683 domain-containing protein [Magnetococcales bacterium]|nr:DUF3683 domain-containing protein [Magnetococcales bacterium]
MISASPRIREIPYNYTSFSDREIVGRFLGHDMWQVLEELRGQRRTGRSARMLFEILGDLWVVSRNPIIQENLLADPKRLHSLVAEMEQRLEQIIARAKDHALVLSLVARCQEAVARFAARFPREDALKQQTLKKLSRITRKDNIDFSGLGRVSHVTDATDWRVENPFVVITPENEAETAPIIQACIDLGLTLIPRGGGTGYTGSGVPLFADTAVINTEQLNTIETPRLRTIPGVSEPVPTVAVGAGAVTRRVTEAAQGSGYVFAVDPTSQNASTIGGNIAMNAGGKKAVMWGSTLDNLLSWRMVMPDGHELEVTRLDHNLGKIHDLKEVRFELKHLPLNGASPQKEPEILTIPSERIRKPGLGKDVTNKYLDGLPGVQKEGCDGIITSAVFVLHRMPQHTHTVCLEFFNPDLSEAVPAIVETKKHLDQHPKVGCTGLEHLDERYVKAVGYNAKSPRGERPKMVLLADVAGEDEAEVAEAVAFIVERTRARGGEGFIATSPKGRARFWADRSRTAAIAAHTNAFKINEDIVIPLERLAEYSAGIERLNIIQSISNKLAIVAGVRQFLEGAEFRHLLPPGYPASQESEEIIAAKKTAALDLLSQVQDYWQNILDHLDQGADENSALIAPYVFAKRKSGDTLLHLLLRRDLRISYRREVERPLKNLFSGDLWADIHQKLDQIHGVIRASRLFAALHMHAGDGNVHTNIPVYSNDYPMLREAEQMVDRIMNLARELDGDISGEHGIGLTKFAYMSPEKIADFARYKEKIDPHGHFNRGKLLPGSGLAEAYTPSLRLVQQETLILQVSALGDLNDAIRHCLRCGKCKPVCTTHVPRANLLYSPRNKILAAGLIIEAFLYEEQTGRGLSLHHFDQMTDVADHCTVCHKCKTPCPVDIDFGKVTIHMREILKSRGHKGGSFGSRSALSFLTTKNPQVIRAARGTIIPWGYAGQRLGCKMLHALPFPGKDAPPRATRRRPSIKNQVIHLLDKPLPAKLSSQTARALLEIEDDKRIPILQDPQKENETEETVFYFPGCGCERLFSDIALASLALLYHTGVKTVLPPNYLCCGFPQAASGNQALSQEISTANRVLFHRIANHLNYLDIKTVLISCGTCLSQLKQYEFDKIFPGCRLMDIHEYLIEKGMGSQASKNTTKGGAHLFHDPCHSPSRSHEPEKISEILLGGKATLTDRCCGEAGTFAVARPDIASQVRFGKAELIQQGMAEMTQPVDGAAENNPENPKGNKGEIQGETGISLQDGEADQPIPIITTCPSCLQGLDRYRNDLPVTARFLAVEVAERLLGHDWRKNFITEAKEQGIEKILF